MLRLMFTKRLTTILAAAVLWLSTSASVGSPPERIRPNILLIVVDDLGYGDLGCYGSSQNRTPHIDRLAKEGLRFTDFHSAGSMCSPTRAAMLTGLYQQRFGHIFDGPLSGQHHRDTGLPLGAVTIAELLEQNGYATACLGKWHLGYQPPWLPTHQGFDLFRGLTSGDGDHHSQIDRSGNHDWWHNDQKEKVDGYTTELLTEYSVEFIRSHREQPFFLYLPHLAIHFPWQGPSDPAHRMEGVSYHDDKWGIIPEPSNVSPHVKAMIEAVDRSTGRILACLERLDLEKQTIVIFTSDNGGYLNYGQRFQNISSNGPLRGQKATLYEGGHRVPMIVRWKEKIRPRETDASGHSVDLFPTLANLANIATQPSKLDGVDLMGLLLHEQPLEDRTLYWRADEEWAVREGQWKLYGNGRTQKLFNLDQDLGEQNNLINQHASVAKRLTQKWHQWEADVNRSAGQWSQ